MTLTTDRIIAPKSPFGRGDVEIPYATIESMRVVSASRQTFLEIRHAAGRLTIPRSAMQSRETFEDLKRKLSARTRN